MAEYRIKFSPDERMFTVLDPEGDESLYGKISLIKMIWEGTGGGLREVKIALDRIEENYPKWATIELLDIRMRERKAESYLRERLDNPTQKKSHTYYAVGVREANNPVLSPICYSHSSAVDLAYDYSLQEDVVSTLVATVTHTTGSSVTVTRVSNGMEIAD